MSAAKAHQALVVVGPVRLPHPLAAEQAARERDGGVREERQEHQHRKPGRPDAASNPGEARGSGEESERRRTGVAEEQARGRQVLREERNHGAGEREPGRPCRPGERRSGCTGRESCDRHRAGEAVAPVHEVEEIRRRDEDERGRRRTRRAPAEGGSHRSGQRQCANHLHDKSDRSRYAAIVIDERDGEECSHGEEEHRRRAIGESRQRSGERQRSGPTGEDRPAACARHRPVVQRSVVRPIVRCDAGMAGEPRHDQRGDRKREPCGNHAISSRRAESLRREIASAGPCFPSEAAEPARKHAMPVAFRVMVRQVLIE